MPIKKRQKELLNNNFSLGVRYEAATEKWPLFYVLEILRCYVKEYKSGPKVIFYESEQTGGQFPVIAWRALVNIVYQYVEKGVCCMHRGGSGIWLFQ